MICPLLEECVSVEISFWDVQSAAGKLQSFLRQEIRSVVILKIRLKTRRRTGQFRRRKGRRRRRRRLFPEFSPAKFRSQSQRGKITFTLRLCFRIRSRGSNPIFSRKISCSGRNLYPFIGIKSIFLTIFSEKSGREKIPDGTRIPQSSPSSIFHGGRRISGEAEMNSRNIPLIVLPFPCIQPPRTKILK